MEGHARQFVFGYGSLVSPPGPPVQRRWSEHGFVADLAGFRRFWGVAMDNRRDLAGYKYYTDHRGRRPEVFVAFLDVCPAEEPGAAVNGLCLPVDEAGLAALDRRERNYERIDITERIITGRLGASDPIGSAVRVWAYVGSEAGRDRLRQGRAAGRAVIHAGYLQAVRAGFARLGEDEHRASRASLDPGGLPVVGLVRHPL